MLDNETELSIVEHTTDTTFGEVFFRFPSEIARSSRFPDDAGGNTNGQIDFEKPQRSRFLGSTLRRCDLFPAAARGTADFRMQASFEWDDARGTAGRHLRDCRADGVIAPGDPGGAGGESAHGA